MRKHKQQEKAVLQKESALCASTYKTRREFAARGSIFGTRQETNFGSIYFISFHIQINKYIFVNSCHKDGSIEMSTVTAVS